jgi:hypothetical protein
MLELVFAPADEWIGRSEDDIIQATMVVRHKTLHSCRLSRTDQRLQLIQNSSAPEGCSEKRHGSCSGALRRPLQQRQQWRLGISGLLP